VPRRVKRGNPHDWNTLDNYLHVHARYMELHLASGFVIADDLAFEFRDDPSALVIRGRIQCRHGLFVDVDKTLVVREQRGRVLVRTVDYAYHAGIAGAEDRPIFRYDNAHSYEGHADAHHKHRFDHKTWTPIDPPVWVGEADWPHLSDVINELLGWWNDTGQRLELDPVPSDDT
jgi:hypothetical protein